MCELAVKVKLYRAAISLSDADSHYFQTRGIRCYPVGLMSVPLHKNIQGGSNMTGTDLFVNKPHCAATVRP